MVHVVVHNSVSADGRVTGFAPDVGIHYEVAATFDADVLLAGSETILAAGLEVDGAGGGAPGGGTDEMPEDAGTPGGDGPADTRAMLAVVDSRGRVRSWDALRAAPHWRDDMVALCSRATPPAYLDHLASRGVDHVVAGEQRVDLAAALAELERVYGARRVLVDSGGTLNGVLLRAGLVDEVSLLVHPLLVDGEGNPSMFRPDAPTDGIALQLAALERLDGGIAWLRYEVAPAAG